MSCVFGRAREPLTERGCAVHSSETRLQRRWRAPRSTYPEIPLYVCVPCACTLCYALGWLAWDVVTAHLRSLPQQRRQRQPMDNTKQPMCSIDPSVLNKSGTVFGDSALSHPARPRPGCSRVAFTTDLSCQHSAADLVSQGRKVAGEFALVGQLVRLRVAPEPTRCQDVLRRKDRGQKRLPNGLIMRRAR